MPNHVINIWNLRDTYVGRTESENEQVKLQEHTNLVSPLEPTCIAQRPWASWPTAHHWSCL